MTTMVEKNMALLRTAYQRVESGDLDEAALMLTEGFIAHVPGCPEPLHGREIWSRGTKMMKDAFPDLRIDVQDMFGVGDKVTALVRFQGTHRRGRVPAVRGDGARRCVPERRGLPLRG